MKVGQVLGPDGRRVVVVEKGRLLALSPSWGVKGTRALFEGLSSAASLVERIRSACAERAEDIGTERDLIEENLPGWKLLKPIDPPEVWATGVTYRRQAVAHDRDLEQAGKSLGLYSYVYSSYRAEVFFKGFDRTTRGPSEAVGLRADSHQVLPEAELVVVLGEGATPLAYTAGNDLTCWDIELESPLFLSQAKIYDGSCSIGPFFVTADSLDPYAVKAQCSVVRNGKTVLESIGNTADLKRSVEEMAHFLRFNNSVPAGSLLFTGTTCVVPNDFALEHADEVIVELEGIGRLSNLAQRCETVIADWSPRLA